MAHQLAGTATGRAEVKAEGDVVEAELTELEQHLTRDAGLGLCALKHVPELALEDAVGVLGLLLFSELDRVLRLLLPAAVRAVLAGAVRTALERLVRAEDGFLEATGNLGLRSAVTCHVVLLVSLSSGIRRDGASEGGNRCAASA